MIRPLTDRLHARSIALVRQLQFNMPTIALGWVALVSLACGLRMAFPATDVETGAQALANVLPYALVIGTPVASLLLALGWFPSGGLLAQPQIRLARIGRWRTLDCLSARNLPLYGATGLMASLLLGMLINIPVRTFEFLTAMPALGGGAPGWFVSLYMLMLADVVVISSLYAIAFVMALRCVPWFPRFLVLVWGLDLVAQIMIANVMGAVPGVPADVAQALAALLEGNTDKVLISIALWLPYLLLSRRVNLTYRNRVPA